MTIAGSGAASSLTTSTVPFAAAAAISSAIIARMRPSWRRTARAVNRPDTSLRSLACRGSSLLIIDALISMSGRLPLAELYLVVSRSTRSTSAYREIPQSLFTGSQ